MRIQGDELQILDARGRTIETFRARKVKEDHYYYDKFSNSSVVAYQPFADVEQGILRVTYLDGNWDVVTKTLDPALRVVASESGRREQNGVSANGYDGKRVERGERWEDEHSRCKYHRLGDDGSAIPTPREKEEAAKNEKRAADEAIRREYEKPMQESGEFGAVIGMLSTTAAITYASCNALGPKGLFVAIPASIVALPLGFWVGSAIGMAVGSSKLPAK